VIPLRKEQDGFGNLVGIASQHKRTVREVTINDVYDIELAPDRVKRVGLWSFLDIKDTTYG
jgi:phage FluMu protein gp41